MMRGQRLHVGRPVLEVAAEPVRQDDEARAAAAEVVVQRGVGGFGVHPGKVGASGVGDAMSRRLPPR